MLRSSLLIVFLCFVFAPLQAQPIPKTTIQFVTSDPAGACTIGSPMQYNTSNGAFWGCDGGTWTAVGGGGGGTCGSLGGDVTGTCAANTVVKVNGGSIPTSKSLVGTNGSGQIIDASSLRQIYIFGGAFLNGGSAVVAGGSPSLPITAPAACTITAYDISIGGSDSGTATVKFLKIAAGTASPTLGSNSINTSGVSLSSGTHIRSTTLSDFTTTSVAAGDIIAVALTASATNVGVTANLECQ